MLVAGNWKMNTDAASAVSLAEEVVRLVGAKGIADVAVCPPFVYLSEVAGITEGSRVRVGAQNMHSEDSGAFTGETSASMLTSVGCFYVILGHSERRTIFGETDAAVNVKAKQAMTNGLVPIVCVGERLEQRESGSAEPVVAAQLKGGLAGIKIDSASDIVVAYEPVWAIGTGRTATPAQAQEMHAFIRGHLAQLFGGRTAGLIQILYGGSVKPGNATELFGMKDVDGGLIGGASLKAQDFAAIVRAGDAAA